MYSHFPPAHLDLEYMEDLRSELGNIPDTLKTLHETTEDDDEDISKSSAYKILA